MSVIPTEGTYSKLGTALHTVFLLWLRGLRTQLVSMRMQVRSLALLSELRIWCCCELCVGCRYGLDLSLLWLWCRPAATAPIRSLAWEPPYAAGAAPEKTKRQKKKKKKERIDRREQQNEEFSVLKVLAIWRSICKSK